MDLVNERAIRDAGTPDAAWLPWLSLQAIQTASLHTLCPADCRLVVIAPHPDDEILACGGLIASAIRQGIAVQVIAVTDGEASHGTDDRSRCTQLGARRVQESHAGLAALGVAASCVCRLGIADGAVAAHIPELAEQLLPLLGPSDVVITTWALDGHPDHEATSAAAAQASMQAGCRLLQAPVWMWHWSEPGDIRVPWHALVGFGIPAESLALKRSALLQHQSQLEDRDETSGPVLVPSIVERAARATEFFFI
ncbi:MAG: PIG-L family deacetylase [Pseudomonadota bacterium]